ncbi:15523_t:CDS:1, partial [Rhizophagus irregularis]
IAVSEEKVKELMQGIIYENIEIDNVQEHHKNMIQKIIRIFIDTRGFTKEPEDSESEGSPASYELENSSEEELEIIIGDKSWKFSELKRRTSSIDEDQLRYIWKIGIKLMIEMDILVTKIFIDKVQEVEEMDEREKELEIREWLEKETVICKRC